MRLLQLRTVIVAHDLTATSDGALRTGHALAVHGGASLHLAHVVPPGTALVAAGGRRAEFEDAIAAAARSVKVTSAYTPHILEGVAHEAVASLAERLDADVIITGRRSAREGVPMDRPMGGTAYAIITRSHVPCLVVSSALSIPLHRVIVAIDCSQASRGALLVGLSWSSALRERGDGNAPTLTAVHVHDADVGPEEHDGWKRTIARELDLLRRNAGGWAGVAVSSLTKPGDDPVEEIATLASDLRVDLVVLGTRGAGAAADGTLGSVSASVVSRVTTPVLLVPPAVWRDQAQQMGDL